MSILCGNGKVQAATAGYNWRGMENIFEWSILSEWNW